VVGELGIRISEGAIEGDGEGLPALSVWVGAPEGTDGRGVEGDCVELSVGMVGMVGMMVGKSDGRDVGESVGDALGEDEDMVGFGVGSVGGVGAVDGTAVGVCEGTGV